MSRAYKNPLHLPGTTVYGPAMYTTEKLEPTSQERSKERRPRLVKVAFIGTQIGRLKLIAFSHRDGAYEIYLGKCACGHVEQVRIYSPAGSKACGCARTGPRGPRGGVHLAGDRE